MAKNPGQLADYRSGLLGAVPDSHLLDAGAINRNSTTLEEAIKALATNLKKRLPPADLTSAQRRARSWWTGPDVVLLVLSMPGQDGLEVLAQARAEQVATLERISEMSADEAKEFLKDLGVSDSGVSMLIKGTYNLLGLQTYFTAGEKEVRCWTIKKGFKAPQAAGVIHTDFEKGFIKAEIVSYDDLTRLGSTAAARDAGKYRLEGKEYVFQDGDVALFRFNN
jgi:CheY-like chemotaxis protein